MLQLHVRLRATELTQHWSRSVVHVRAALFLCHMHLGYNKHLKLLMQVLKKFKLTCKVACYMNCHMHREC